MESREKKLIDLYLDNSEIIDEGLPVSITTHRSSALEEINLRGLPFGGLGKEETYDHSKLGDYFGGQTEQYFTPSYTDIALPETDSEEHTISVINGFCSANDRLKRHDCGVISGSLKQLAQLERDQQSEEAKIPFGLFYNSLAGKSGDTMGALNTVFAQDGACIFVPEGVSLPYPIRIRLYGYAQNESVTAFPRVLIIAQQNSHAQVIIEHRTLSEEGHISCCVIETVVGEGANIDIAEIYDMNSRSAVVTNNFVEQSNNSRVNSLKVVVGGEVVKANINVTLVGSGAENNTNGLAICGTKELFDFATNIEHFAPDCTSNEQFNTLAAGDGTGVFQGRVYVAQNAQRTQAFQRNRNLMMGHSAHIFTKPQLEIYADNVKCSHGATIGQLNEEAVYYMRQRGISEEAARKLQMHGFVNEIIAKCPISFVCNSLQSEAIAKIESL